MTTQALENLRRGERRRRAAASWRRRVIAQDHIDGVLALLEALGQPGPAEVLPLERFLRSARWIGSYRAEQLLQATRLPPQRYRVRDLAPHERLRLTAVLEHYVGYRECVVCGGRFRLENGSARETCSSACAASWARRHV